eukprot:8598639-Pyramimonas_sp.AAC.1
MPALVPNLTHLKPIMVPNNVDEEALQEEEEEAIEREKAKDKEESEYLFKVLTDKKMQFRVELEARTKQVGNCTLLNDDGSRRFESSCHFIIHGTRANCAISNIEDKVFTVASFSPVDWNCVLQCVLPELALLEPAVRDILDKGVDMLRASEERVLAQQDRHRQDAAETRDRSAAKIKGLRRGHLKELEDLEFKLTGTAKRKLAALVSSPLITTGDLGIDGLR